VDDRDKRQLELDESRTEDVPFPKATNDDRIRCSTCQELILQGAKKCIHCESFQDWRRHLTANTAILAACISLVVAIPAVVPFVHEAWRKSDSNMAIAAVSSVQYGRIHVLMTNFGKKAGAVDFMKVLLPIKEPSKVIYLHLDPKDSNLIPGDSSKEFVFAAEFPMNGVDNGWDPSHLTPPQLNAQMEAMNEAQNGARIPMCEVEVQVISFQGKSRDLKKPLDCRSFRDFLLKYWNNTHPNNTHPQG
jgi:hypothetical protein